MPHDIVLAYTKEWETLAADNEILELWNKKICQLNHRFLADYDETLEQLWNSLDDTIKGAENILCVVDGSGSMTFCIGDSRLEAIDVSNALGIYFAERLSGPYKDRFITFSSKPEYVDLSKCKSLREKIELAFSHDDCTNTDIKATFRLVLETAVKNHLKQEELPSTILVISDMEFDYAVTSNSMETLFEGIDREFKEHGYKMPRLVFWNCNSRTNVIPVRENEFGVGLVSGFSVNVCKMVLSGKLDPYECLKEQLDSERYAPVGKVLEAL